MTLLKSWRAVVAAVVTTALTATMAALVAGPAEAAVTPPDHLVIAAVWGANSDTAQWTNDWIELYNPTDADIALGTVSGGAVTSSGYSLCYRGVSTSPQKCSTTVKLTGTVKAHHYFFVWYANAHTPADDGTYPAGFTPDLDVAVKTAANGQQQGSNMGGCNTGGQVLLLDPNASNASAAATFTGDLSSPTAKAAGVVDGVGWMNAGTTQPNAAESNGATPIAGVNAGTTNACVIARTFTDGVPVDTDTNRTDFSIAAPATFAIHSQISDHVAVDAVPDTEVSRGEAMAPIQVKGRKGTGALSYAADGLPDGVAIDPATGVIGGTPAETDALQGYPVTVTVTDSSPTGAETATTSFTLTVSSTLRVDAQADVTVRKGTALEPIQISAHGGTPDYQYAATGLPSGVAIDPATGVVSGTPTAPVGRYAVHATATDSGVGGAAQSASVDFTIVERPKASSPGGGDALTALRINEVRATGTPGDDWVEIVNTGAAVTGAAVSIVDVDGATYHVPTQDVAAHGFVVVDGSDLDAAGLDLTTGTTLDLTSADDTLLDETTLTSLPSTSWARFPDGTGDFAVAKHDTRGATNSVPAAYATDHLVVAAVYGADGTAFNSDWVELYNPTDEPVVLGTIDGNGVVTPNYYQCYRSNSSNTCSSMKLYGTVQPHHYFLVWNGHNADANVDAHSKGVPPAGITPDLDFRYGSNDTNSAATKAANDPSGQSNNGFGGCNTGGQLWLLNASSNGVAPGGDMSSVSARAAGVVDGVGWTANGATQPTGAESTGAETVTGLSSGTNNACVITRRYASGYAIDSDANSTDFTTVQDPGTVVLHAQASDRVAITPIGATEISLNGPMDPIQVEATAIWGDLTYAATGLPGGISIDPSTGIISGTPTASDELGDYPVTVTVSDDVPSDTATTSFTLTVSKVLRLDPISDLSVHQGAALTGVHATAHGGFPGYTYAATGLPAGVAIDPATGVISGTPTAALGRYDVHVTATDSGTGAEQGSVSRDFTIVVLPPVGGPSSGDPLAGLALNEVRTTGTPAKDWVEIYNTGDALDGAALALEDRAGDTYVVPTQDVAAHGFVVVDGADLDAAGLDLAADDTLYLTEADGTLLDETSWSSRPTTSWARHPDGTGEFGVAAYATRGAPNSGPPEISPNDLLVTEVNYDNNSTDYYEYSEITNTTDHPIDFSAYGLTVTKSGAVMTLHDPSDTSQHSPTINPVIPAHGTQVFWWVENQYGATLDVGAKTSAQFRANYGIPTTTPVVLVYGFASMANSGGDHSFYISVNKGSTLVSRAYVDTPCAANTFNGAAVCTATNGNYAEHYRTPADRSSADAAVWYNSLYAGGDSVGHPLKKALSSPATVDLEQLGFTRGVKITATSSTSLTLTNTTSSAVDLSGYVLEDRAGADHVLPPGTTLAAGADLVLPSSDTGFTLGATDWVTLLAPRGYAYTDGAGIVDTTGPLLTAVPYDSSTGGEPVIDETTGLPLPPAGGLYRPAGISAADGTVYVSNTGDNVLASITDGETSTVAGSLTGYGDLGDEGPAKDAQLYQPGGTAVDADGNIYVADSGDNVIRKVTADGVIHRFAGTGVAGGAGATVTAASTPLSVNLWHPNDVAVDSAGNVFIADTYDNRVLEVSAAGAISVVAGTGRAGYTGDGTAGPSARLSQPAGVAVDSEENVYIADASNNVVRRVDGSTGQITTVAGDYAKNQSTNGCLGAYSGDGGPATSAQLNTPQDVALDGEGNLFIADTFNHAIRQVSPGGTISTLVNTSAKAGTENLSPVGGGSFPWGTHLNTPYAVAVDRTTNIVYIADTKNNAVAQVVHAAFTGDASGPVEPPEQVAITGSGTAANACAVLLNGPVVSASAPTVSGTLAVGSTLTADAGAWSPTPDSFTYQWLRDGVPISGSTQATYTATTADAGHLVSVAVTPVKDGFSSTSTTSAAVLIPVPVDPQEKTLTTVVPTVSGGFVVGSKVRAVAGAWKAGTTPVTSFDYQWLRNGVPIPGATSATYTVTTADYRTRVAVQVTGAYPTYTTASALSASHVVAAGALTRGKPAIHGPAKVGRRLTASPGTWRAGTVKLTASHLRYQWFAGGKRIAGATKAAYKIPRKLAHQRITVRVTGLYPGYATATATSRPTPAVKTT
ncbi:hypothetical protein ASC77_15765 [Nocardioides sp. Root1257]|uniref:putative Ig domain-containing protein n=1 Tax=unclassified Nocardioides TaxID=2615069 RepID=UPI0006FC116A|nr:MULTISPECIES: putative Ig domain-containing protein [unclassified Nocardioides]KQW47873.1 hypothetical protein ASC77_15765 [Nocardioides sp. Root1257]KRC45125.1 hypothetical protein ASE24_16715 [Nocardioides sp. Root224]